MTEPVRRVNYFAGQLLSTDALQAEQDYHRRMRYLHNRLHGWGVAEGLEVTAADGAVVVAPGVAVDPLGREIVLTEECHLDWAADVGDVDVWVTWAEEADALIPGPEGEPPAFSRWLERPRLSLEPPGAAMAESVLLARVSPAQDGSIAVDTSARQVLGAPPVTTAT